ncbi:hypothetical protein GGH13_005028, partial [Coemansia sp. S155-1]
PCEALPTVNPKLPETISEMPDASMLPSADAEEHKSLPAQHWNAMPVQILTRVALKEGIHKAI